MNIKYCETVDSPMSRVKKNFFMFPPKGYEFNLFSLTELALSASDDEKQKIPV
jgi:hypothetical protein